MRVQQSFNRSRVKRLAKGVSLLELMVVVAIVGVLAAIAYPSYVQYIVTANRNIAKSVLLQVADRQEQFFADNKTYAADLTNLGYGANGFMIDDQGAPVPAGSGDRVYSIALTNTSATTYTVNAAPQLRQAGQDDQCMTMTLDQAGLRSQTGPGNDCW